MFFKKKKITDTNTNSFTLTQPHIKYTIKTNEQLEILNEWLINNVTNLHLDRKTKKILSEKTGLTERQVYLWFKYQIKKLNEI